MRQLSCSLNFSKVLSRAIHDLSWAHIAIFLHFELDQTSLWEISRSSGTLVIHQAHSSIKSIKSGSSEALHPPVKKEKREKEGSGWGDTLTRAKKKGQRERMEKPRSNTTQRTFIHHTHAHDQVLRWHDLSKTRFLILQNKWGRYATLSLPRATQKAIKK